jgi:hypothetical protein
MKLTYIIFAFVFLIPLHNNSTTSQVKEPGLIFNAVLKGTYNFPEHTGNDSLYYFLIEVKLTNNLDSSILFLAYDCATAGNIVVDNNNINTCYNMCAGNSLSTFKLNPSQEFSLLIILKTKREYVFSKIKLGWIWLTYENTISSDNYLQVFEKSKKNLENILWSNPLQLSMSDGIPWVVK